LAGATPPGVASASDVGRGGKKIFLLKILKDPVLKKIKNFFSSSFFYRARSARPTEGVGKGNLPILDVEFVKKGFMYILSN